MTCPTVISRRDEDCELTRGYLASGGFRCIPEGWRNGRDDRRFRAEVWLPNA
jgi:hypothetical protein